MAAKLETQASFAEEIDFNDLKFEKVRNREVDIFATLGISDFFFFQFSFRYTCTSFSPVCVNKTQLPVM